MKRNMKRVEKRWRIALMEEPPDAQQYAPFKYKSDKQRRLVHAKRRERGGGAYVRTHDLRDSARVKIDADDKGGTVQAGYLSPDARWVTGEDKQPMFDASQGGVPWLDEAAVNARFLLETTNVLEETFITVSDPTAGVR